MSDTTLKYANLSNANLNGVDLRGKDLTGTNLSGLDLGRNENLSGVTLKYTNLSKANFRGFDLRGKDLTGANLSRVDLSNKDLSGTILMKANLSGVNLSGVDLRGKDLTGTNLSGLDLSNKYLSGVVINKKYFIDSNFTEVHLKDNLSKVIKIKHENDCLIDANVRFDSKSQKKLKNCKKKYGKGYAILGDSHSEDIFYITNFSKTLTPFIFNLQLRNCHLSCYYNDFLDFIRKNRDLFFGVIYVQSGTLLLKNGKMISQTPYDVELNKYIYPDKELIQNVYNFLDNLSSHISVVWLGPRIEPHINKKMILMKGCDYRFRLRPNQRKLFEELDTMIETLIGNHKGIRFVSQIKLFRFDFPEDFMSCKGLYWRDGEHFSNLGIKRMSKRFDITKMF